MNELYNEALQLAQQLQDDIKLASTRLEHVRLTARANEATSLANRIKDALTDVEKKQEGI